MTEHTLPIVGAHFRPPAKFLLQCFRLDQELVLIPEPDNPYDPNAIAVHVLTLSIPADAAMAAAIDDKCSGSGHDNESIREPSSWHLGFIPKEWAQLFQESDPIPAEGIPGKLGFSTDPKKPYTITFTH